MSHSSNINGGNKSVILKMVLKNDSWLVGYVIVPTDDKLKHICINKL